MSTVLQQERISFRNVALPVEHGGWGLLLEPVVLGLLVQPSGAGALLSVAATASFLLRHPLKLAAFDRLRSKRYARTRGAEVMALLYAAIASAAMAGALFAGGRALLLPLLAAAPLIAIQLSYDVRNQSRNAIAESCGTVGAGALAAAVGMAGGMSLPAAAGLWLLMLLRSFPSILYIRARLRLQRNGQVNVAAVILVHVIALLVALVAVRQALLPWLAAAPLAVLLVRASVGLSPLRWQVTAKQIGYTEVAYGIMTVVVAAIGYSLL